MISKTIGSGGDFAELTAAVDWLIAEGSLADDYTFTDISGYIIVGSPVGFIGPLEGFEVIFTSDNSAYGNPNGGYPIVMNGECGIIVQQGIQPAHNGSLIFEHKNITSSWLPIGGPVPFLLRIRPNAGSAGLQILSIDINDIIIRITNSDRIVHYDLHQANDQPNTTIKITDSKHFGGGAFHSIKVLRVDLAELVIENVISDSMKEGIIINPPTPTLQRITYRNVVSMRTEDLVPEDDWEISGNSSDLTIENCADSDDTLDYGSNNQNNINPAREFQSIDSTNSRYLKLLLGIHRNSYTPGAPQLGQNGTAPVYAGVRDIENNLRPGNDGFISIGPTEQQYVDLFTSIVGSGLESMIIDSGAVYIDFGLATEQQLGATKGGNVFAINTEMFENESDGMAVAVIGGEKIKKVTITLTCNFIELDSGILQKALVGSDVSDYPSTPLKTHDSITRDSQISASDYFTNVAIVGEVTRNKTYDAIIILKNPIVVNGLEVPFVSNEESVVPLTFLAHADEDDLETDPFEIRFPIFEVLT